MPEEVYGHHFCTQVLKSTWDLWLNYGFTGNIGMRGAGIDSNQIQDVGNSAG